GRRLMLAVLSGGLDSCVAAWLSRPRITSALTFDYGQRHSREIQSAALIASFMGIPHRVVNVRGLLTGSALTGECDVPHGHYAEETMKKTVVPGRNLVFASVAAAIALQQKAG